MDNILREFYHGMICPEADYQPTEEGRQERRKLTARQTALLEKLRTIDPDTRAEVEGLFEVENAVEALELEEVYVQGMRMGARLTLALLEEKKA